MTINVETGGGMLRMTSDSLDIQLLMETFAAKLKYIGPLKMDEFLKTIKTPDGFVKTDLLQA